MRGIQLILTGRREGGGGWGWHFFTLKSGWGLKEDGRKGMELDGGGLRCWLVEVV